MKTEKTLVSEWKQVTCKYREVKPPGCSVYRESLKKKVVKRTLQKLNNKKADRVYINFYLYKT